MFSNNLSNRASFSLLSLLFILVLGIFLKLLLVSSLPVYHDVGWYISLATHYDSAFMNLIVLEHPPFGYYPYFIALQLLGIHDWVIRLVPFLFSLIELGLVYLIAKKWFDTKTAWYTVALFSLTYFAAFNALSPEGDGSIMGLFSLLLLYSFFLFYDAVKRKNHSLYFFLSCFFLGFLLLIKVRAIIVLLPLFLYSYYKTRNILQTVLHTFLLGFFAALVFCIFPLLVFLASPDAAIPLLKQVLLHNTGEFSLLYKFLHPMLFLHVLVVLTPLLVLLFFFGVKKTEAKKENDALVLLTLWFVSLFCILLLVLPEGLAAAYPRYISFLAPVLLLLCARGLVMLDLSRKMECCIFFGSLLVGGILSFANQHASSYWFLESAAMGILKIAKWILVAVFGTCLLFVLCYFISKKKVFLCFFLTIALGFNLFLLVEPLVDTTHKDMLDDITAYYHSSSFEQPIFLWAEDLAFYFGIETRNINLITDPALRLYAEKIGYDDTGYYYMRLVDSDSMYVLSERGGTVFALYYPLEYTLQEGQGRREEYLYLVNNCSLLQEFSYPHALAVVYEC